MQRTLWLLQRRSLTSLAPTAARLAGRPGALISEFTLPRPRPAHNAPPRFTAPHVDRHNAPRRAPPPVIKPDGIIEYFEKHVEAWSKHPATQKRLYSFGISQRDAHELLTQFVTDVQQGRLSDPASVAFYQLGRFAKPHDSTSIDIIYSTTFFSWIQATKHERSQAKIPSSTLSHISRLVAASARRFPEDEYPLTRATHRKVIMHVGPTNSGKTHHALRALAGAPSGVYAGPLRLLAHEIWERLNTGQIVPLGMEQPLPHLMPKYGHPRYVTPCNMITGEEVKFVSPHAKHTACTVEMLSYRQQFSVAVVDEIQMIADPDRGHGWTSAVLGLCADEVHLCGEETAVPIVEALLKNTGDTLEVRRYERLTPLVVEDQSLEGDWSKVRKGDCIVTFSRSGIFRIKETIEAKTGMRCAVVYGRLPPEVRSEQAALFNDPNSGYDVLIGSDAIGMGLNLKIKRIVFDTVSKWEGKAERPLSVSAVKQIAGRAGRFGLHRKASDTPPSSSTASSESQPATDSPATEDTDLGGTTTTFQAKDLSYLRHCIAQPPIPLPFARIGTTRESFEKMMSVFSPTTSMRILLDAQVYVGELSGEWMRPQNVEGTEAVCKYLDLMDLAEKRTVGGRLKEFDFGTTTKEETEPFIPLSIENKVALLGAPIPWRDEDTVDLIKEMLAMERSTGKVWYEDMVKSWGPFLRRIAGVEAAMAAEAGGKGKAYDANSSEERNGPSPRSASSSTSTPISSSSLPTPTIRPFPITLSTMPDTLKTLEMFHKALVFYMWMSFRNPVVYATQQEVGELKARAELCLNFCLSKIGTQEEKKVATGKVWKGGKGLRGRGVPTKGHLEREGKREAGAMTEMGLDKWQRSGEVRRWRASEDEASMTPRLPRPTRGGWNTDPRQPWSSRRTDRRLMDDDLDLDWGLENDVRHSSMPDSQTGSQSRWSSLRTPLRRRSLPVRETAPRKRSYEDDI